MRASGSADSARALGPHDHLCWAYDDRDDFLAAALDFLAEGLAAHQRVQYIAEGDRNSLRRDLDGLDDHGCRGEDVELRPLDDVYGPDDVVDAEAQVAAYRRATDRALADGFSGLRVAAEATPLVRTAAQRRAFTRYEHLVDRYMVDHPFSALCGYDRSELGREAVAEMACRHPLGRSGTTPFRMFAAGDADLCFAGEVDIASIDLFRRTLADLMDASGRAEIMIDARDLTFVDHRSLTALEEEAARRGASVVLRSPLATSHRLAGLLGLQAVRVEAPA